MGRNRTDEAEYRRIGEKLGLSPNDVGRAVKSYFESIARDASTLPFDNPRKIFSKERFNACGKVVNIPYIGRMGPVYSRYLKWRANVSVGIEMAPRSSYRSGVTRSEIEGTAEAILSGRTPPPIVKKKGKEMFERVWLVGVDGKKSARQVIPKKEE